MEPQWPSARLHFDRLSTSDRLSPTAQDRQGSGGALHLSTSAQDVLITLHRPSNVDEPETLREILLALDDIAQEVSLVFPVHPRTRQRIDDLGFGHWSLGFRLLEPLGYLDFLAL